MKFIKDCIIHTFFINANNPEKERLEYCKKNCQFKCIKKEYYKKK